MISTVYLIDPDAVFRLGLGRLFAEKYQVEVVGLASKPEEAEDEISALRPDLLIVDPASRVYESIPYLRKFSAQGMVLKVALLCERLSATAMHEVRGLGLDAYAIKPLPLSDMHLLMDALLHNRTYVGPGFEEFGGVGDTTKRINNCSSLPDNRHNLSERETQILVRTVNGKTAADIAKEFDISIKTAEWHRRNVFSKVQVKNIAQLTKYALRTGIIALD